MKNQSMTRLAAGLSLMALASVPAFAAASAYSTSAGHTAAQLVDFLIPTGSGISVVVGSQNYTGPTGVTLGITDYNVGWTGAIGNGASGQNQRTGTGKFVGGSSVNVNPLSSDTGLTGLPFDEGVVLSTGRLLDTRGTVASPNDRDDMSQAWRTPGSALLESQVPSAGTFGTADAATLTWRFTTDEDVEAIFFQYAFGSEEYSEYVGSAFNDAFAFVLTEYSDTSFSTIVSQQNLAKIGSDPVSINTINAGMNSSYFADNAYSEEDPSPFLLEFDGIAGGNGASSLYAISRINPNHAYQIDIVIADVNDDNLDAAVFLGAGSFTRTELPPVVPEPSTYIGALALAGLIARRLSRKA